ncbi:2OG-Fe(II) oxygenase family protein [Sphingomonas sp.]|uniref:2OG-Fe(II) oxygenase family protein n=1 Tax=Sphingomonas sp. TaxID=28214 RepID=UPI003B00724E
MLDELLSARRHGRLGAAEAMALAEAALDAGREDEVVSMVAAAARDVGDDPSLWQWTALLYRGLDRRADALRALAAADRLAPDDPRIAHAVARTRLEAGLPALEAFERARRLAPNDGEILLGRAAAQCAEGETATAIAQLDATLSLTPEWFAGHETVARLRFQRGGAEDFTRSVRRALVARPTNVTLWRTLLSLLDHARRYEDALSAIVEAKRAIGDHNVVVANEAIALSELGRRENAESLFARLDVHTDPALRVRRARHFLRHDEVDRAVLPLQSMIGTPAEHLAWPYLSIVWRLTGNNRADWLDGDARFVSIRDIACDLPPLDRLAAALRRLHGARSQPLDQSLRGGTQTDGSLFERLEPEIVALRVVIVKEVTAHVARLPPYDPDHPLLRRRRDRRTRFSGSWSVRLADTGFHANHNHPAGWISSALYVALPAKREGDPPQAGWLTLGQPQAELGLSLEPMRSIEPRPGRLVLFPSTMWHGTVPFAAGERLTVAFDVAPPS